MVCADIIDHELIDGEDKYWIESYRVKGLLTSSRHCELTAGLATTRNLVDKCFPLDGPPG
jgi:hypothetical protein